MTDKGHHKGHQHAALVATLPLALLLLTACTSTPPPLTADGPLATEARAGYEACTVRELRSLAGTNRTDSAVSVATVAEGACSQARESLRLGITVDNVKHSRHAEAFANGYVDEYRKRIINAMAAALLKAR